MIETRTLDKPGRLYDADEQCQLAYGQAAKFCGGGKFLDVSTESDKCDCPSKLKILTYIFVATIFNSLSNVLRDWNGFSLLSKLSASQL